jgi:putative oxidoreductase
METLSPFMAAWYPRALALLRIVTGYLFIWHGTAKHFQVPHIAMFDKLQPWSLPWIAGWLEVVGGALIILGLFTRPTAFVMSGLMAAAYFIGHASRGHFFLPILNAGELAVLYCFVFLFLSVAGPGAWSLDSLRTRARAAP